MFYEISFLKVRIVLLLLFGTWAYQPLLADSFALGPDLSIDESAGTVTATVTRVGLAPLEAKTITLFTVDESATRGLDYQAPDEISLTFPANSSLDVTSDTQSVTIQLIDDSLPELQETFFLELDDIGDDDFTKGSLLIKINPSDVSHLTWDDGTSFTPSGTTVFTSGLKEAGDIHIFRITTEDVGLWRTRLTVLQGEANLFFYRGTDQSSIIPTLVLDSEGSDGTILSKGEFDQSEEWYIAVESLTSRTRWQIFSGNIHVIDQGTLVPETANSYAPINLTFPPEEAIFFKAAPSVGAKAWSIWLNDYQNGSNKGQVAVRKNQPGLGSADKFDFLEDSKMLLVPPYLGDLSDIYFVSIQGREADSIQIDSHLIEPTKIDPSTSVIDATPLETGAPFAIYEVDVPDQFIALDVSIQNIDSGDPNLAVRRGDVGSQWQNDAFSEISSTIVEDSVTMVPPVLANGTWYFTIYSDDAFQCDLINGQPEATGSLIDIDFLDDDSLTLAPILQPGNQPADSPVANRSGWAYFRANKIAEQSGILGWSLSLLNARPKTELAIRQNAVPSIMVRREQGNSTETVLSKQTIRPKSTNAFNARSQNGLLQRPSQQADIWYVGVYLPEDALGSFQLKRERIIPDSDTQVNSYVDTVINHPARSWKFYRFDLLDGILGWETLIRNVERGNPRLIIRRGLLPRTPNGQPPEAVGPEMNSGERVTMQDDWFPRIETEHYRSMLLATGDPLTTNSGVVTTYYAGIFNQSDQASSYTFTSRAIDDDANLYPELPSNDLVESVDYEGGVAEITNLNAGASKFYKVTIPENTTSWKVRLTNTSGDSQLAIRRGVLPDYTLNPSGEPIVSHGGIKLSKIGNEVYQLLPSGYSGASPAEFIVPDDYYLAVIANSNSTFSGSLISEGAIPITTLGIPSPDIEVNYQIPADELSLYQFRVPNDVPAIVIELTEIEGNVDLSLRADNLIVRPSIPLNSSYGYTGGNTPEASADIRYRLNNPNPGLYSLTLQAARTSDNEPQAGRGTLSIRIADPPTIDAEPLALEGGSAIVSNQAPNEWRYFSVEIPDDGLLSDDETPILAWHTRLKNISETGDPNILIIKDSFPEESPTFGTTGFANSTGQIPSRRTSWPDQSQWAQLQDYTGRGTIEGNLYQYKSFMAAWGKPLDGGSYIVAVINDSDEPSSYEIISRTAGEIGSSSSLKVRDLDFAGGNQVITDLSPREFEIFRVTIPETGASSWNAQLFNSDNSEACLSIRKDFVPDFTGGSRERFRPHVDDSFSWTGGGRQVQRNGDEHFTLFPKERASALLPGEIYYITVNSAGNSPDTNTTLGEGPVSLRIQSNGEVPSREVTLINERYNESLELKPGEIKIYTFNIPQNSKKLEIELTNEIGNNTVMALRRGDLIPAPYPSTSNEPRQGIYQYSYGVNGGNVRLNFFDEQLISLNEPLSGTYTLVLRSVSAREDSWLDSSSLDLRIEILDEDEDEDPDPGPPPVPLAFCGGSITHQDQAPDSWAYYEVTVPNNPDYLSWDIQILSELGQGGQPELWIRKNRLPTFSPLPSSQSVTSRWRNGSQWPPDEEHLFLETFLDEPFPQEADWTGDIIRKSDSAIIAKQRGILNFGQPLTPGTYFVGVYSRNEPASYTLRSRCIGKEGSDADITVSPLLSENSSVTTTVDSREAAYFSLDIPPNTHRTWQVKLNGASPGETTLCINKGFIPSFYSNNSADADFEAEGIRMQRAGDELYTLLPSEEEDLLRGGTYYLAIVGLGDNESGDVTGTGSATAILESTLDIEEPDLGMVGEPGNPITRAINLEASSFQGFHFTIPDSQGVDVVEIRLDNKIGNLRMSLRDDILLSYPALNYAGRYGRDGGSAGMLNDGQIMTLVNPTAGQYTLTIHSEDNENNASAELIIQNVAVQPLAFDQTIATAQQPSTHREQLLDRQQKYYRVEIPEFITTLGSGAENANSLIPTEAWKISLIEATGDVQLRVHNQLRPSGGLTTSPSDDIAIIVPPVLQPGRVYFIEVTSSGLSDYTIISETVRYEDSWLMPPNYNEEFADTSPTNLSEDDWHFYLLEIPEENGGLLRTELIALSGNPDLFIREEAFPTTTHNAGWSPGRISNRNMTDNESSYANWVPIDGRFQKKFQPGRWVLGVQATNSNARYHLKLSTGNVTFLDYDSLQTIDAANNPNEVTNATVLSNDFQYYQIDIPPIPDTPSDLAITFTEDFGDINLRLRDTVPPGNAQRARDNIRNARSDNKNHWDTWAQDNNNLSEPGTKNFRFPNLRPGTRYFIGMQGGRTDGTFSLDVSPSSSKLTSNYGFIPTIPFNSMGSLLSFTLPAGQSIAIQVPVPANASEWNSTHTHSNSVEFRLEQGTLPVFGSTEGQTHLLLRNSRNTALTQEINNGWPWVGGYDYYILFTNTGLSDEAISLTTSGLIGTNPFTTWASMLDLTGNEADPNAILNPLRVTNLMAYGLGFNPRTGLSMNGEDRRPRIVLSDHTNPFAGLEFYLPQNLPNNVNYVIRESQNLEGPWEDLATQTQGRNWTGKGLLIENASGRQTIFSPISANNQRRSFFRLHLELQDP